ncbi:MAG: AGE family epimerase/isomerase [Sedimentisphaerales bacterium]|nr:AGE family epimerase/isomerase [Sedimentisphaerales bacterium]
MTVETIQQFSESVKKELDNNLVPFWHERIIDAEHGGFIGQMSNEGKIDPQAPKGLILNARLLWTFSALHRFTQDPRSLNMAQRAYEYLEDYFWDREYGGTFWQVDFQGHPLDDKKKIYGQAFYIYALAEYYQAFGETSSLQRAKELFDLIETHSRDQTYGGYIEVCNRNWTVAEDLRLSEKDMDEKKSMNNHLHLLEAYTNLYRIWPDAPLRERLKELIDIFEKPIADSASGHLFHFFNEAWEPRSANYTFGHDIEASWLLCEAAEVLNDQKAMSQAQDLARRLADVTLYEGLDEDGGLCYEGEAGQVTDSNREWWPQAESVVGFINAYERSGDPSFLNAAQKAWDFIEEHFIDRDHGDWFWRIDPTGRPDPAEPKVSQWKGPYHSVRACLETIRRLTQIEQG